ncbi:unnamed protein product [Symbiodinium sp. CCMP2592]|nr:unnamed protein product [Symbiodinium sp. CCMP2592]
MENSQEPSTTADDGAPVELPSLEVPPAEELTLADPPASEDPGHIAACVYYWRPT